MKTSVRSMVSVVVVLALLAPAVSPARVDAQSRDLFNNFNTGGTLSRPGNPTMFTLTSSATIVELDTYHWNGGRGANPGSIALRNQNGQMYGPYPARGSSGQGGAGNVNWTATPNVTVPAGTYTVLDSDPNTWSHNPQSQYRGFAIVRGSLQLVYTRPTPPPPPVTPTATPGFRPCFVNSGSVAAVGPCVAAPGAPLTVQLSRTLPRPPALLVFKAVLAPGVPAAVRTPLSGSGAIYTASTPTQLCATGSGGVWDITLLDSALMAWGTIGRVTMDCRAFGR